MPSFCLLSCCFLSQNTYPSWQFYMHIVLLPLTPILCAQQVPAFTAFVSQFGGYYMDDWSISKKAIALLQVRLPRPCSGIVWGRGACVYHRMRA